MGIDNPTEASVIQTQCTNAIEADALDHLCQLDGAAQKYPENAVDDSIIAKILVKSDPADISDYDNSTDSQQALSDKLGGFSGDGGAAQDDSVKASLDLAHTDLDSVITYTKTGEATGDADIDISESDYTGYIELLKVEPNGSSVLADLSIFLDWNKTTTGFDTIATAGDTLDCVCQVKVDGTNWRFHSAGTQVTANGDGSLDETEDGQVFRVGPLGAGSDVRILVKLSAERDDCEIPYRVVYVGASTAPTVTAVAAA